MRALSRLEQLALKSPSSIMRWGLRLTPITYAPPPPPLGLSPSILFPVMQQLSVLRTARGGTVPLWSLAAVATSRDGHETTGAGRHGQ